MTKIIKNINSIEVLSNSFITSDFKRILVYKINENKENLVYIYEPERQGIEPSNIIKEESDNFINGYKMAIMDNGQYAYIREEDEQLLDYRYDLATDFNEYGFAMVAKRGQVAWINKSFQYYSSWKSWRDDHPNDVYFKFEGFSKIVDFNKGPYPTSSLYNINVHNQEMLFFPEGNIKNFYEFNGYDFRDTINKPTGKFNNKGYLIDNSGVFLYNGIYIPVMKFLEETGELDNLLNSIQDRLENSMGVKFPEDKTLKLERKK